MKKRNIKTDAIAQLKLPRDFPITKELIDSLEQLVNPNTTLRSSQRRNSRKLDALSLLKTKRLNGIPTNKIPEGFIYILSNPAWSGCYKVGYSLDPHDRLSQYQVGCPFNDYKIEGYYFSSNARETEASIHKKLSKFHIKGEWFNVKLDNLRKFILRNKYIIK